MIVTLFNGCSSDDNKAWEQYSPLNTTSLMKQYVIQDNFEEFKKLLQEGYEEDYMIQMYEVAKQTSSASAKIDTFTLVTYDNGKILIVHLTPQATKDGEVLTQDIIELPAEMATYIEEELNQKYKK